MLVLKRDIQEAIVIETPDGLVEITILSIEDNGRGVKLGFLAPRSIQIDRKELFESKRKQNEEASRVDPSELERFQNRS
jgi:carbon storage regulator